MSISTDRRPSLCVEIQARLDEWATLIPPSYHTVEGMDALSGSQSVTSGRFEQPVRDTVTRRLANRGLFLRFASRLKRTGTRATERC